MRDTSVIIVWSRPIKRIKNVKTDDGIIRTVYSSLQLGFFCFLCLLCFLHLLYLVCGSFFGFRGSCERVRPKQSFFFHCQTAIRTNLFANTHFALICFGSSPRCVLLFFFTFLHFLSQPCSVLGLTKHLLVACLLPLYRTLFFWVFCIGKSLCNSSALKIIYFTALTIAFCRVFALRLCRKLSSAFTFDLLDKLLLLLQLLLLLLLPSLDILSISAFVQRTKNFFFFKPLAVRKGFPSCCSCFRFSSSPAPG